MGAHRSLVSLKMSSWVWLVSSIVVQIVGYSIFLKGFFPPKVVLLGFGNFLNELSPFENEGCPHFERLIVMVVDAMRSDFMFSALDSNMSFLHSLIEVGNAIPFTAYSNPPTVTLPRLKGITTGGTPNFIDAILNVADDKDDSQSLANTDSWIRQFKNLEGGRVLHFFGDDTWLKLFPPSIFFEKYEGTGSFFVSDYTEVDNNVTRHLNDELENSDWDALILHYLGMDHIGHKGGPSSPFMKPKQEEMDEIVKRIYTSNVISSRSTLMVLMGDHGMNDFGNHGGSSLGETSPGMVLISPKFSQFTKLIKSPIQKRENFDYYTSISQIDIVPTLAALFNFPIPKNNIGVVIPEVLDLWNSNDAKRRVLIENCEQFLTLLAVSHDPHDPDFVAIRVEYENIKQKNKSLNDIIYFLRKIQTLLSESATNYSYADIWTGLGLILIAFLVVTYQVLCYFFKFNQFSTLECFCFFCFCVVYSLHFHGSSLIEEEHQIWWFFVVVTILSTFMQQKRQGFIWALGCLVCLRMIKGWNDSGQKFISTFTIASSLSRSTNLLWVLVSISYLLIPWLLYSEGTFIELFAIPGRTRQRHKFNDISSLIAFVVAYFISLLSFLFKLSQSVVDGNDIPKFLRYFLSFVWESFGAQLGNEISALLALNIQMSRLFTFSLGFLILVRILIGVLRGLKSFLITDLLNLSTLFLMHQSRIEVVPIFLVLVALRYTFRKLMKSSNRNNADLPILSITMFILCVQNLSFFSIGNTNLLATIDLSNAYNGVADYDIFSVGFLTFISNFSVLLYWSIAGLQIMFENGPSESIFLIWQSKSTRVANQRMILNKGILLQFFYCLSMINLVGSCINLRYHLFIWSVFCPKLLYFSGWAILVNIAVDFAVCLLIVTLK